MYPLCKFHSHNAHSWLDKPASVASEQNSRPASNVNKMTKALRSSSLSLLLLLLPLLCRSLAMLQQSRRTLVTSLTLLLRLLTPPWMASLLGHPPGTQALMRAGQALPGMMCWRK
jgi:hypothetical protein